MNAERVCFELESHVPLTDAEMSLHLAMFAVEGLFGRAQVRLDARYELNESHDAIVVDASTPVGVHLVRVFTSLLQREFGDDSFRVRRIPALQHQIPRPSERTVPV